jgi:UDP-N-acetylmuramate--alanine ligase
VSTDVFDLGHPRRVHVVAAGGAGMSAIATLLAQGGHVVTGSDAVDGPALEPLRRLGVRVHVGHDADLVAGAEVLVASTAVAEDNPELQRAHRDGIAVMRRREFLDAFAVAQPFLSVAGTHGKTTTSSMLAVALRGAGEDPSFLIGAPVPALGGAAALGAGRWMVIEADESDGSFLAGPRAGALLTNAEPDHLEYWGGWDELRRAFADFLSGTQGPAVVCSQDPGSASLGKELGLSNYGTSEGSTYRMVDLSTTAEGSRFNLLSEGGSVAVELLMPGVHNALNAAGALALLGELGLDMAAGVAALREHTGLHRRFEHRGEAGGVRVVDDYAHLPTEVRAALAAGRQSTNGRLVVVFQPHRYSRTAALWREFGPCFGDADVLVLTDVYPAGEPPRPGVSGMLVVDAAREAGASPRWAPSLAEVVELLEGELRPGDLLMTVGAGDVRDVGDRVLRALGDRNADGGALS